MIERKRAGLSAEQKVDLWSRWKAGQSLHEIGRALGKDFKLRRIDCKPVLRRPLETTRLSGNGPVLTTSVSGTLADQVPLSPAKRDEGIHSEMGHPWIENAFQA
jgi:hypothetical protein